jgi:small-conductance mechanosensitive channel/CRP-like cAMP-binding protein
MNGLTRLLGRDLALTETAALLLAAALALALRLWLRPEARPLVRAPLLLLAGHVVVFALDQLPIFTPAAHRLLGPLSILLLLASLARSAVLLVLDVLVGQRLGRPLPRIVREIVQGLVYAGAALFALHEAGVEPGSILTTSALLTAVVGLSLQETLGNVFAGLAIQLQSPFEVGDWIQFDADPKHIGRVVEINWRATKVITLDEVEVVVPNATLAKAPITTFTKPTRVSRRSVYVAAPYSVPPLEVHRILLEAVADAPGVVEDPAPSVVTNLFGEYGIEYWVRFFTAEFHRRDLVDGGVRDRIWYALRRADVEIPYPHRTIDLHEVTEESSARELDRLHQGRARALCCVDILKVLSNAERHKLAEHAVHHLYAAGEVVVRQGDDSTELYLIERGEVVVSVDRAGSAVEVARLGAGKFFGEMALVTGDRRQATVRAVSNCELLSVGRDALRPILEKAPDLAERIGAVLVERQAELEERTAAAPEARQEREAEAQRDLVKRIRQFFAL